MITINRNSVYPDHFYQKKCFLINYHFIFLKFTGRGNYHSITASSRKRMFSLIQLFEPRLVFIPVNNIPVHWRHLKGASPIYHRFSADVFLYNLSNFLSNSTSTLMPSFTINTSSFANSDCLKYQIFLKS